MIEIDGIRVSQVGLFSHRDIDRSKHSIVTEFFAAPRWLRKVVFD